MDDFGLDDIRQKDIGLVIKLDRMILDRTILDRKILDWMILDRTILDGPIIHGAKLVSRVTQRQLASGFECSPM